MTWFAKILLQNTALGLPILMQYKLFQNPSSNFIRCPIFIFSLNFVGF